jgi:S-DNA-T family DNA segregation ATPase FtsK/SpoIIIE
MNRRKLHNQADRIEWVLAQHKAPARVTGGRVTPSTIQFHVAPGPRTRVAQVEKLGEEIALALGARHARVTREKNRLQVEVPRETPQVVDLMALVRQIRQDAPLSEAARVPGTTLLGLAADGVPLMMRLTSPDVAHVMVSGTTGSGKTELVKSMLASLILFSRPRDVQLVVIDLKAHSYRFLSETAHLAGEIAVDVDQGLRHLRWLESEMEQRQLERIVQPRVLLVVDELADLLMQGGREINVHLTRLAQRGRSAGISIIAATQKPTAEAVGSSFKANFPVRLVGKMASADDARVGSGTGRSGAEKLGGRGDFLLLAGSERIRFQSAYLAPSDIPLLVQEARSHSERRTPRRGLPALVARLTGNAS